MQSFATRRHVPFTAAQMFALVADIERYPEFLPFCTGLKVLSRRKLGQGEEIVARMSVGYKAIAESFTTRVVTEPEVKRIDVSYLNGPFKHLENRWKLIDEPKGSTIDFFIAYEFKSRLFAMLVGAMFDQIFRSFAEAFEKRARDIYVRAESTGLKA